MTDLKALTEEVEWKLCEQSPLYFLEHYWKIPVVGKGASPFNLRDFQKETLNLLDLSEMLITLKARQIGMTTIVLGYAFWHAFFHVESPWLLISRNERAAIKMLQRATYGYIRLPAWMKRRGPNVDSQTQTILEFDSGSRLESVPATGGTGRGDSVYGAVLDEFAFMEYADDIYGAVEPLVYGKMIVMSTANGMGNPFHTFWLDAQLQETAWNSVFYPWWTVPGRDEAWYEARRLRYRGQEWKLFQEYPANPQEAFSKSGRVAFSSELLDGMEWEPPEVSLSWGFDGKFYEEDVSEIKLDIWRYPHVEKDEYGITVQKPNYVVSVDVAEGLERGDWTSINVFDANTLEEVAACYSHINVEDLGPLVEAIGYFYYNALIGIERNNHGLVPIVYLQNQYYPRMYRYRPVGTRRKGRSMEYGWVTSSKTKPKMVLDFLKALKNRTIMLHDERFMIEAQTFVADGSGSYSATEENHDDKVMSTLIGEQLLQEQHRFPVIYEDHSVPPLTMADVIDWEPPVRNGLDVPIGNRVSHPTVRRSFLLHPANIAPKNGQKR